nr:ATP synthase F0 subunit 8 [Petalocephala gongshanensis]
MPQMSPLWWFFLILFFLSFVYLSVCLTYFVYLSKVLKTKIFLEVNHFFWLW